MISLTPSAGQRYTCTGTVQVKNPSALLPFLALLPFWLCWLFCSWTAVRDTLQGPPIGDSRGPERRCWGCRMWHRGQDNKWGRTRPGRGRKRENHELGKPEVPCQPLNPPEVEAGNSNQSLSQCRCICSLVLYCVSHRVQPRHPVEAYGVVRVISSVVISSHLISSHVI